MMVASPHQEYMVDDFATLDEQQVDPVYLEMNCELSTKEEAHHPEGYSRYEQ